MANYTEGLPLLSVIVPVYNSEATIKKCIQSICNQTYTDLEIIIVDDGSDDRSYEILCELKKQDSRIKIFCQSNSGPAAARNTGLKNAGGDLLAFVDSDDTIASDMYESMFKIMIETQCDIVICDFNCVYAEGAESIDYNDSNFGKFDSGLVLRNIILSDNSFGGGFLWNKLINYKKIRQVNGKDILFNEKYLIYEDKCWCINALSCSEAVYITEKKLYNYNIRMNSISHDVSVQKMMTALDAWDYMLEKSAVLFDDNTDILKAHTQMYLSLIWMFRNEKEECLMNKWKKFCSSEIYRKISLKSRLQYIFLLLILGKE